MVMSVGASRRASCAATVMPAVPPPTMTIRCWCTGRFDGIGHPLFYFDGGQPWGFGDDHDLIAGEIRKRFYRKLAIGQHPQR